MVAHGLDREYCGGGSLADQLEHGRIEEEDIVKWYAYQMLHGLQYLHSKVSLQQRLCYVLNV